MADRLVIVGAGGFGRETVDVVEAINAAKTESVWDLVGVVDDALSDANASRLRSRGIPYLGTLNVLMASDAKPYFVVAIGAPRVRRTIAERLHAAGFEAGSLVHPAATLGSKVRVGSGTIICAGARITTNISLGMHVQINPNCTIGHDTSLGHYVSMNPASTVSGDCNVADEVLIGAGAVVLNQLTVGFAALVGGSACVIRDVAASTVVAGVPAQTIRGVEH